MALSPPVPVVTVTDYPSGLLPNLQHHIVYVSRSLKCCSINLVTKNLHLALSIMEFPFILFLKVYNIHFFVFSRVQGFHLDLVYDVVLSGNRVSPGSRVSVHWSGSDVNVWRRAAVWME